MGALSFMHFIPGILFLFSCKFSNATDTLTLSESITNGETLVSNDGSFELGFFSPGNSRNYYLGIWFKNIPDRTVVWVANRSNPMNDSSGVLMINKNTGNLVLLSKNRKLIWSSNETKGAQNPVAQLLDSGNFVFQDGNNGNSENYLWQSFDYPTDTLIAGMKHGLNLRTGLDRRLTSWKNWDDPSPGDFIMGTVAHNFPEATILKESKIYCRTGPWNGIKFSGTPQLKPNPLYDYEFVNNGEEIYFIFHAKNKAISRLIVNQTSNRRERFIWDEASKSWSLYAYLPLDYCDSYRLCGPYGSCIVSESPVCQCLRGFTPKSPQNWDGGDWSKGCVRNKPLNCSNNDDGFIQFTALKLPDTTFSWVDKNMNLDGCKAKCLLNCSCTAYTNFDVRNGGSGCAIWFNDLIDIREVPSGGQDIYIRMSASELADLKDVKAKLDKKKMAIIIPASTLFFGILLAGFCYFYRRRTKSEDQIQSDENVKASEEDLELPLFDFIKISHATNRFSPSNKLGEGGFGPVYKGTLQDGEEIAIKRLSSNSGQGLNEFKNEVKLIAKLQHRNLVKLLGCCIEGDERMLIYEYMPNKSLDHFIFDQTRRKSKLLDWSKRFNIVCGIARGLLYLHQDSRLRIIHRDLKTSNILLDNDLNPKISDFGMAKTFAPDQTEGNTKRVVGTYGYMAPEYASDGLFSVKSDVFSFGILMLEIISGKKSRGFYHPNHNLNLIGYSWRLWKRGNTLELVDPYIRESCNLSEVTRCIHISLLCVQQNAEDRPSMAFVVLMLGSEIELPLPKEPGFYKDRGPLETDSSSSNTESFSANEVSISLLDAR